MKMKSTSDRLGRPTQRDDALVGHRDDWRYFARPQAKFYPLPVDDWLTMTFVDLRSDVLGGFRASF